MTDKRPSIVEELRQLGEVTSVPKWIEGIIDRIEAEMVPRPTRERVEAAWESVCDDSYDVDRIGLYLILARLGIVPKEDA